MVPPVILIAALLAVGGLLMRRRSSDSGGAAPSSDGAAATWATGSGVVLPDGAAAWLDRLAELAGAEGLAVYVTSGDRSAAAQAAAMLTKQRRYDAAVAAGEEPAWSDDLHRLYQADDVIDELLASGRDEATWTAILEEHPVSPHQGGRALDLRTRDLPGGNGGEGAQRLAELVEQLGGSTVLESDHLHVQGRPWAAVA